MNIHDTIVNNLSLLVSPKIYIERDETSPETYYPDEPDLVRKIKSFSVNTPWEWGIATLSISYGEQYSELSVHVSFSSEEDFKESLVYQNLLGEALSDLAYKLEYMYYPFFQLPEHSLHAYYKLASDLATTHVEFHSNNNDNVVLLHAAYADINVFYSHKLGAFLPPSKFFTLSQYDLMKTEVYKRIASILYGMLSPLT